MKTMLANATAMAMNALEMAPLRPLLEKPNVTPKATASMKRTRPEESNSEDDEGKKKSVRWSTVTVYEFGVGIGGSAVPKHGGPAICLAKEPSYVWKTDVEAVKGALCGCASRRASEDGSSSESDDGQCDCGAMNDDTTRRRHRVRWFKPLERISLLEKAGFSEKKIYRMLMESSDIAMSRRLSLRLPSSSSKKRRHE